MVCVGERAVNTRFKGLVLEILNEGVSDLLSINCWALSSLVYNKADNLIIW